MKNLFKHIKPNKQKIFLLFFAVLLCLSFSNYSFAQINGNQSSADTRTDQQVIADYMKKNPNARLNFRSQSGMKDFADKVRKDEKKNQKLQEAQLTETTAGGYTYYKPTDPNAEVSPEVAKAREEFNTEYAGSYSPYGNNEEDKDECTPPQQLKDEYLSNKCIFCPFFSIVYNMVSSVAKSTYNIIAPSALVLVGVGMALWLATAVIQFIATIDKRDPKDLIQGILVQSFKIVIVVILLNSTASVVFGLFLEPILLTGLKIPGILFDAGCGDTLNNIKETLVEYDAAGRITKVNRGAILAGGGLPPEMGAYINCIIWQVEQKLMNTVVVGATIMCIGWEYESLFNIPGLRFIPHFGVILMGLTIFVWSLIFLIGFPFYMIDTTVKLGLGAALIPVAVAGWPFKSTSEYSKKVIDIFLECMFTFIALAVIMYANLAMIETALNGGANNELSMSELITDPNYIKTFIRVFNWSGVAFLNLLFILVLCQTMIGEMNEFARFFVNAPGGTGKLGGQIGGRFASLTRSGANKLWSPIDKARAKYGKMGRRKVANFATQKYANMKLNKSARKTAENGKLVSANNSFGGTTHERKVGRKTVNVQTSLSGNTLQTTTHKNDAGTEIKEVKDKYLNVKTRTDKEGNVLRQEIQFNNNNMLNKDGTINTTLFNDMVKNSMHDPKMLRQAMAQQVLKQQFGIKSDSFDYSGSKFSETTNDKGQVVVSMTKVIKGQEVNYNLTYGNDGRVMCEETTLHSNGQKDVRKTDGILERSYRTDKDGNIDKKSHRFNFSDKIKNKPSKPIDSLGNFHKNVPIGDTMFDKDEINSNIDTLYKQSRKEPK